MILVDPIRHWPRQLTGLRHEDWSHLVSDESIEELHAFARRLGLLRSWFQDKRVPHYDVTAGKRVLAVRLGAREVTARELVLRAVRKVGCGRGTCSP